MQEMTGDSRKRLRSASSTPVQGSQKRSRSPFAAEKQPERAALEAPGRSDLRVQQQQHAGDGSRPSSRSGHREWEGSRDRKAGLGGEEKRSSREGGKERERERDPDRRDRDRDRDRSKERERGRSRRDRSRERSRERGRGREVDRDGAGGGPGRSREGQRERDRVRERDHDKNRERGRERDHDRGRDRDRHKHRERDRGREQDRDKGREREREKSHQKDPDLGAAGVEGRDISREEAEGVGGKQGSSSRLDAGAVDERGSPTHDKAARPPAADQAVGKADTKAAVAAVAGGANPRAPHKGSSGRGGSPIRYPPPPAAMGPKGSPMQIDESRVNGEDANGAGKPDEGEGGEAEVQTDDKAKGSTAARSPLDAKRAAVEGAASRQAAAEQENGS